MTYGLNKEENLKIFKRMDGLKDIDLYNFVWTVTREEELYRTCLSDYKLFSENNKVKPDEYGVLDSINQFFKSLKTDNVNNDKIEDVSNYVDKFRDLILSNSKIKKAAHALNISDDKLLAEIDENFISIVNVLKNKIIDKNKDRPEFIKEFIKEFNDSNLLSILEGSPILLEFKKTLIELDLISSDVSNPIKSGIRKLIILDKENTRTKINNQMLELANAVITLVYDKISSFGDYNKSDFNFALDQHRKREINLFVGQAIALKSTIEMLDIRVEDIGHKMLSYLIEQQV